MDGQREPGLENATLGPDPRQPLIRTYLPDYFDFAFRADRPTPRTRAMSRSTGTDAMVSPIKSSGQVVQLAEADAGLA